MSSQLNKICPFQDSQDQEKNSSFDSDYANRNEMKRIENNSDRSFSSDIDKINESLYKINSFLKITKEIDDIKKENLVKNDIQRKLSLKSQWLNSAHGSTGSLTSLPPIDSKKCSSITASTQSLNKSTENEAKKKRKIFSNFKSQSVQNVNVENEKPRRLRKHSIHNSCDELQFVDKLKLSDEDISRLSQEPEFRDIRAHKLSRFGGSSNSLKVDSPKRVRSVSDSRESLSKSSSQRDLSKYFPKVETKTKSYNVNKNQKELKDVDLSKYFLPAPVQELKSIPSPSQSPKLPRKPINSKLTDENSGSTNNLLRTAIDNLQKLGKKPSSEELTADVPKKQYFTMHDQQLDGDVTLKIPIFTTVTPQKAQKAEIITDDNCDAFFDSLKSPTDNLDEIFDQVAADALPGSSNAQREKDKPKPKQKQKPSQIPQCTNKPLIKISKTKSNGNQTKKPEMVKVMSTDNHKYTLESVQEADILGKLSCNLLNEIKLLEQHLELNGKLSEQTVGQPPVENLNKSEEELNNFLDDILNSSEKENVVVDAPKVEKEKKLAFKQNMPVVSKPKKVTQVKLPKAMQVKKIDHKPPISGNNNINNNKVERKTVEIKSFDAPELVPPKRVEVQTVTVPIENNTIIEDITKTKDEVDSIIKVDIVKNNDIVLVESVPSPVTDTVSFSFKPKPIKDKVEEVTLSLPRKQSVVIPSEPPTPPKRNAEEKFERKHSFNNSQSTSIGSEFNGISKDSPSYNFTEQPKLSESKFNHKDEFVSKPSLNDARKAYFAELNHQPSSSSTPSSPGSNQMEQIPVHDPKLEFAKTTDIQNPPPIKPMRRRSRKSSLSNEINKNDQSHNKIDVDEKIETRNLTETVEPKYKNDIPELNNIARLLNSSESSKVNHEDEKQNENHESEKPLMNENRKKLELLELDQEKEKEKDEERIRPDQIRGRTDYQRNVRKSFGSGDYDNLPSYNRRAMFKDSKVTSRSFDTPTETNRDYDNVVEKSPARGLSPEKKRNVTDMLLERSKAIHNKKQDFINEKLVETNPYIRRMIQKEHRYHRPTYPTYSDRSYISSIPSTTSTDRSYISSIPSTTSSYDYQPTRRTTHRPMSPISTLGSSITHTPRATMPSSSSNRSVLDLFSRPASSNKDSCIIS